MRLWRWDWLVEMEFDDRPFYRARVLSEDM